MNGRGTLPVIEEENEDDYVLQDPTNALRLRLPGEVNLPQEMDDEDDEEEEEKKETRLVMRLQDEPSGGVGGRTRRQTRASQQPQPEPVLSARSQRYFNRYSHQPVAPRAKVCRDVPYNEFHTQMRPVERNGLRSMGVDTAELNTWAQDHPYDGSWMTTPQATPHSALQVSRAELSRGFFDCENEFKIRILPTYTHAEESSMLGIQVINVFQKMMDHMTDDVLKGFVGDMRVTIGFRSGETTKIIARHSSGHRLRGSNVPHISVQNMLMEEFDDDIDEDYDIPDDVSGGFKKWSAGRIMYRGGGAWIRGGKIGGSGAPRNDQTPIYIQFHLLKPPSGGGRRGEGTRDRVIATVSTFNDKPSKFSKSITDCGTTNGTEDCGVRALAYLYLHKHNTRVKQDEAEDKRLQQLEMNKKQRSEDEKEPKAARKNNDFRANYRKGVSQASLITKDAEYILSFSDSEHINGRISVVSMATLCVEGCLGIHSRVRVFELTDEHPRVIFTTPDKRETIVNNQRLAYRLPPKHVSEQDALAILDIDIFEERERKEEEKRLDNLNPNKVIADGLMDSFVEPPETRPTEWFNLLLHNDHYYAIVNAGSIHGQRNWCDECSVTYKLEERHMCASKCEKCYRKTCPQENEIVHCAACNRDFHGGTCFSNHREKWERGVDKNYSVCESRYECSDQQCKGKIFNSKELDRSQHKHGLFNICWSCNEYYDVNNHDCVIRSLHPSSIPKPIEVWYYDFETDQSSGEHLMNYAVIQNEDGSICRHFNSIQGFCDYVFDEVGEEMEGRPYDRRLIAHNGGRFDVHLIVRHMMTKRDFNVKRIARGRNNMFVRFFLSIPEDDNKPKNRKRKGGDSLANRKTHPRRRIEPFGRSVGVTVTFIDSINFIGGPLRNFPKTFGLEEINKGDFPHYFNTEENQNYKGSVPHIMTFGPDTMTDDRLAEFLRWYYTEVRQTEQSEDRADRICEAIQFKYRQIIGEKAEEQPQSKLLTYKQDWNFKTEMARYCEADVTVLRLGCEKFRKSMMDIQVNVNKTGKRVTVHGRKYLPGERFPSVDPFSLVTIAGLCQKIFLGMFYKDKQLRAFPKELERELRNSFSGGRTEAHWIYFQSDNIQTQEIRKVDFTSEYPHVNKNGLYPTGKPRILLSPQDYFEYSGRSFETMNEVMTDLLDTEPTDLYGLDPVGNPMFKNGVFVMNSDYIPPRTLKIPVLWSKVAYNPSGNQEGRTKTGTHKLVFDLNRHDDTWICSIEIYEAFTRGYKFENIKKIIWWPAEQTVRGLFEEYVNMFLKMKIESEGWPKEGMTEEEKRGYITHIQEKNPGVLLEYNLIAFNPVRRAIAKLCLNNLWGKWNQRSNMVKQEFVRPEQYNVYWGLMTHPDYHTKFTVLIPDKLGEIRYTNTQESVEMVKNTCITVGIFTTAQGRMMWYRAADKLDHDQLLYGDTDSLMYWYDRTEPTHRELETRENILGALADEFKKKKNKVCVEFISGGPKNYGYLLVDRDTPEDQTKWEIELKIKGFNLRSGVNQLDSARNMLTYRKVIRMIVANALQNNLPLLEKVTQTIRRYDPLIEEKSEAMDDITVDAFLETNLGKIPVTEKRFTKTNDFRIRNDDVVKRYGYVYNKAEIDHLRSTPTRIRTVPFGYETNWE